MVYVSTAVGLRDGLEAMAFGTAGQIGRRPRLEDGSERLLSILYYLRKRSKANRCLHMKSCSILGVEDKVKIKSKRH